MVSSQPTAGEAHIDPAFQSHIPSAAETLPKAGVIKGRAQNYDPSKPHITELPLTRTCYSCKPFSKLKY